MAGAKSPLEGRIVFIARLYLIVLGFLALAAPFFHFLALLLVSLPAAVAGATVLLALALMRLNRAAGAFLLAVQFALAGAFFLWAQARAQEAFRHPPFIVHQVGSALHRHLFPYSPLVLGMVYLTLAVASLPISARRRADA